MSELESLDLKELIDHLARAIVEQRGEPLTEAERKELAILLAREAG